VFNLNILVQAMLEAVRAPRRRAMLRLCWDRERTAGEIAGAMSEISFAAVSQHLRILRDAGAVEVRRSGRQRFYQARREALGPLALWLEQMWGESLDRLAQLAEREDHDA
jgi:DNA-binding transcriptional ArsR family regulator